jgi:hypothetical protein
MARSYAELPLFVDWEWEWDESLYAGSAFHYGIGRMPYPQRLAQAIGDELGLDGTGRLLDVGCGPGSLTLLLSSRSDRPWASTLRVSPSDRSRVLASLTPRPAGHPVIAIRATRSAARIVMITIISPNV